MHIIEIRITFKIGPKVENNTGRIFKIAKITISTKVVNPSRSPIFNSYFSISVIRFFSSIGALKKLNRQYGEIINSRIIMGVYFRSK